MPTDGLSSVVDALVAELAVHRRLTLRRHAAYLELARAILTDNDPDDGLQADTARSRDRARSSMQS